LTDDTVSEIFGALADPTRRWIFDQLLTHDAGLTATELANDAAVSRQAIVKHLQILVRSGLASAERDGREVRYVVTTDGTTPVSAWLTQREAAWDRRVAKLGRTVQRPRTP
jgi:DNA-binding transcriptional ArsR family regulator